MFYYGKKEFFSRSHSAILALALILLLIAPCLFAVEKAPSPETVGYEILPLKYLSIEQGKQYLTKVVTGTITHFPGSSALLVTARPNELAKAKILLDLVDEPGQFIIKTISPIPVDRKIPSNEQIVAKLSRSLTRGVSIGSFFSPPSSEANIKAIIDIHNDVVVAIAPASFMDQIMSVVQPSPHFQDSIKSNKPCAQDKPAVRHKRKVSQHIEPKEANFLLSANNEVITEPNAVADILKNKATEVSSANQLYQPPPLVNGEQVVNLVFEKRQTLTIIELLGLVGPYLQLDFMYTERDVNQRITLNPHGKFAGPIKVKDLYPLLDAVLKLKNLAMTRNQDNLVTIAPVANTLDIDPSLLLDDKIEIERGDGMIQRIVKLDHIETRTAKNLIDGMKLTTNITEVPETKTLIITAYTYRMPRIQILLDIIDQPGEPKKFRFRPLQYTMAETLAPKLQALAEQLGTVSISIKAQRTTPAAPTARPRRKPGESTTAYNARLRAWLRSRQRRTTTTTGQRTTAQQPERVRPTVYVEADERTNRILMIGLDEQLDNVEDLIDTLDVAHQDLRSLKVYKIEHVDAEEVKRRLEELDMISPRLTSPYASRMTGNAKSPRTSAKTAARTAATSKMRQDDMMETPLEEPQVVVITQINSLLVNATTEQHAKIVKIKDYVDRETDEGRMPVEIYFLENQSPTHLEEVLNPLIEQTIMDKEGKAVQEVRKKQEDDQIEIVADPNTFSLIVYANKRNQEWIGNLIRQLDQRRPQVLIDVTLVQINKDDDFMYDLNVIQSFPDLIETSGVINPISMLADVARDRFIEFQSNPANENPLERGKAFYGDKHINLLLTAMQKKSYGRVLAKPKILVNDNEAGTISTIDRTYVTKTSSIPVSSGGAGQEATLIQTAVDYEDYPAGITLSIVPHISRGDFLRLDITLERSDFDLGTLTGEKPPDTTESNIETVVTVPDKSTIILGGLIKLDQSKGGSKVPILGDIPILGGLFRSSNTRDTRRNLYVFVKAEIIRSADTDFAQANSHLQQISNKNRDAFEEHEKKFHDYHDWPGLKPKPIKPVNVLDAQ